MISFDENSKDLDVREEIKIQKKKRLVSRMKKISSLNEDDCIIMSVDPGVSPVQDNHEFRFTGLRNSFVFFSKF